jgi:ArsR family transcriptional regulator
MDDEGVPIPVTGVTDEDLAQLARALSHPARVHIVRLLAAQAECRGSDVFADVPLSQSTVSEHLRVLIDAGVVTARRVGTSSVYCLRSERLAVLGAFVQDLLTNAPSCAPEGASS